MKLLNILSLLIITAVSCTNNQKVADTKPKLSPIQDSLINFVERYKIAHRDAPNEIIQKELKTKYLDSIKLFMKKYAGSPVKGFKVTIDDLGVAQIGEITAFHASFYDQTKEPYASVSANKYYMEFDYEPHNAKNLDTNSTYKYLKQMRKGADTTLTFVYMGEAEWEYSTEQLKLRVVPIPDN